MMAVDMTLLKGAGGEIMDESQRQEMNVEKMLVGFLRALLDEQRPPSQMSRPEVPTGGTA
jgi:hypothetical protein